MARLVVLFVGTEADGEVLSKRVDALVRGLRGEGVGVKGNETLVSDLEFASAKSLEGMLSAVAAKTAKAAVTSDGLVNSRPAVKSNRVSLRGIVRKVSVTEVEIGVQMPGVHTAEQPFELNFEAHPDFCGALRIGQETIVEVEVLPAVPR